MTENLIRLRSVRGVGNATLWNMLRRFGSADGVLGASVPELRGIRGVTQELAEAVLRAGSFDPRPEMEHAVAEGVDILPYDDPEYPAPLLHSFDPPSVLYVRGRLTREDWVAVGIVGTRNMSKYGRDQALELAAALAAGGYTVVSGLARGVDTFAHIGALNAKGRTVGVLGCGFDHMYPEENRDLAVEMTRSGAVVTEFSMGTPPSRDTFPVRNRIIAGMVLGLLVIEAPLRSGSLITARLANEIGRTVFAIPGRMDDARSEGCNKLIRDGAVMVTTVDDIFTELNPQLPLPGLPDKKKHRKKTGTEKPETAARAEKPGEAAAAPEPAPEKQKPAKKQIPKLDPEQQRIFNAVTPDWIKLHAIAEQVDLSQEKTMSALALLKLMRLVEQGEGQSYKRR